MRWRNPAQPTPIGRSQSPVACPFFRPADKQVFPKVDVLGWYVTGAAVEETHMQIHKRVGEEWTAGA